MASAADETFALTEDAQAAEAVPQFVGPKLRACRRQLLADAHPIVQMMVGDAIGDAVGFGIEMRDALWIRQNVNLDAGWPASPPEMEDPKYAVNNIRGMYSDDAEMTVGLMKALMRFGVGCDEIQMMEAWKDEWELAKQRPPPATPTEEVARQGHGSAKIYFCGGALETVQERQRAKVDPGNAPPMRALPLSFFSEPDRARLCAANANATHPHPKAIAASWILATVGHYLMVERGEKDRVFEVAISALERPEFSEPDTKAHLLKVAQLPDYEAYGPRFENMAEDIHELLCGKFRTRHGRMMKGIGSDSMRTVAVVLYLVRFHRGPRDVLQRSIDIGGDVDSLAALTLGLVGAVDGLSFGDHEDALPWQFLEELEGVEYLVAQSQKFDHWLKTEVYRE